MSNPIFSEKMIKSEERVLQGEPMTVNGAINKSLFMFACLLMTAAYTFMLFLQGFTDKVSGLMMAGFAGSIVAFLVIIFARKTIKYMAPIYAISEGLLLGGFSCMMEKVYPGIVIQAVGATFMAFFVMLVLYKARIIKYTEKFRSILMISMFSIFGIYLVQFIGSFFHLSIPGLFSSGLIGIGFSLFVCVIAALNFIMDFANIEYGAEAGMDKNFEWYCAFGLMVSLVWLYIEVLNLLAKLRNNN